MNKLSTYIIALILIASVIDLRADLYKINLGDINKYRPKMAIVLSGGALRGVAHVGVFKELERQGVQLDYIVGTSIGSIIGGMYSSGYSPNEIDSIVRYTNWQDFFAIGSNSNRSELFYDQKLINDRSILSFRFNDFKFVVPEAISLGSKYVNFLNTVLWKAPYQVATSFDDLKYKFRAVATDLNQAEPICFHSGNLATVLRASSTLPLRFSPVRYDDKILVDGGIFANMPTSYASEFNPDYTILVDVSSPLLCKEDLNKPWNVADQVISIQMKYHEEEARKKANLIITPNLKDVQFSDFHKIDTIICEGEIACREQIHNIHSFVREYKDSLLKANLEGISNIDYSNISFHASGFSEEDSKRFNEVATVKSFSDLVDLLYRIGSYKNVNLTYNKILKQITLNATKYAEYDSVEVICPDEMIRSYIYKLITTLNNNEQFHENQNAEIKDIVLNYLSKGGYNFSTVKVENSRSTLKIQINVSKLNNIIITGNTSVDPKFIKRNIKLNKGDYISVSTLATAWEDIFNTNLFSYVEIQVFSNHFQDDADIYVNVKEIGSQRINLGIKSDEAMKTRVGVDLLEENFLNIGARANFQFIGGERYIMTNLSFEQPRLLDSYFTYKMQAYYEYKRLYNSELVDDLPGHKFNYINHKDIGTQALGLKFYVGSQIQKSGRIALEGRYELQRYYPWDVPDEEKGDFHSINTGKLAADFDTEDKSFFPTAGYLVNLSLESNLFNHQMNNAFTKAFFKYKNNATFGNLTISPKLILGFADKTTPFMEFFDLASGTEDGFYGILRDQEKGRQIVKAQMEFRYKMDFIRIFFDTYLSLRYDLGSVWKMPEQIKFSTLKHGLGISLQLDTPIGPAKFSVGNAFKFTKAPNTLILGPLAFYSSIGVNL